MTLAALYVLKNGPYFNLPGVDPWDEERDARLYPGPWPVVAHPPCARWCRLAGQVEARGGKKRGDDDGCFAAALAAVRRWGGVLEHPEASAAWDRFGLRRPPRSGGWVWADALGWTCCVDQGHYGHRVSKPTWLYMVGCERPDLIWGPAGKALDNHIRVRTGNIQRLSKRQRSLTPEPFRDLLLAMARSVEVTR
jgi:hypothetical protein